MSFRYLSTHLRLRVAVQLEKGYFTQRTRFEARPNQARNTRNPMNRVFTILPLLLICAGCVSFPQRSPTPEELGPRPADYEAKIKALVLGSLRDPESARFQFEELHPGWTTTKSGPTGCWMIKVWVNAKNGFGGYAGKQPYWFVLKSDKIILETESEYVPEANWQDIDPPAFSWQKVR